MGLSFFMPKWRSSQRHLRARLDRRRRLPSRARALAISGLLPMVQPRHDELGMPQVVLPLLPARRRDATQPDHLEGWEMAGVLN